MTNFEELEEKRVHFMFFWLFKHQKSFIYQKPGKGHFSDTSDLKELTTAATGCLSRVIRIICPAVQIIIGLHPEALLACICDYERDGACSAEHSHDISIFFGTCATTAYHTCCKQHSCKKKTRTLYRKIA